MGSMWLRWVCSDVGVVCSDRCIMGQVVDRHGGPWVMGFGFFGFGLIWAFFWVFSGLINVSWVKLQSMWLWGFSGLIIDVFLAIFWVNHVASTFSGLIGVSWVKLRSMWLRRFSGLIIGVFLGIFWVDHVALMFSRYFLSWSVYHGSSSDRCGFYVFLGWSSTFFWVFSTAWVSNPRCEFLIGGFGGGCGGHCWLQMVCVCVALLMVWWFVFMCGFVDGLCLCLCLCVCVCGDGFG